MIIKPLHSLLLLVSGTIKHIDYQNDEDIIWSIGSDCSSVQIESDMFDKEQGYDFVKIEAEEYSGTMKINQTVSGNFTSNPTQQSQIKGLT